MDSQHIDMEIRTSFNISPEKDPGYIELHYMELNTSQMVVIDDDFVFRLHQPFIWSIDVDNKDVLPKGTRVSNAPTKLIYYAISGDEKYVATLSIKDEFLRLDVWDMELKLDSSPAVDAANNGGELMGKDAYNEYRAPFTPNSCAQSEIPIPKPVQNDLCTLNESMNALPSLICLKMVAYQLEIVYDPMQELLGNSPKPASAASPQLSVSFDASKVALTGGNKNYLKEHFLVFAFKKTEKANYGRQELSRVTGDVIGEELKGFCGFGKFHFTSTKEQDPKYELFITCDGMNVDIYNVHGKWETIRRIPLSTHSISNYGQLIEGLSGKYFSWSDKDDNFSVCNLETGRLVFPMASFRGTANFSRDGSLMICLQESNIITTRWTESGTMIGASDIFNAESRQAFPAFINNGRHFIVPLIGSDDRFGLGSIGMILDTSTHFCVERVSFPTYNLSQQLQCAGSDGQYLYSLHGSKLDLIRLQDIVIPPYPRSRYPCNKRCLSKLTKLKRNVVVMPPSDVKVFVSPSSDLTIAVEFQELDTSKHAIVISVSNSQSKPRVMLSIPPTVISSRRHAMRYKFYVDKENLELIVGCVPYVMVWKLPTTIGARATLQLAWWRLECKHKDITPDSAGCEMELAVCTHGQAYTELWDKSKFSNAGLRGDDPLDAEPFRFINGLFTLISMFEYGDDSFRQAVLQYVGRYANRNVDTETVLTKICREVTQKNYELYGIFLKALLDSDQVRWAPKPGLSRELNPISIFLGITEEVPRAINLAWIVIDYCIRMAKGEHDPQFLSPVLNSLKELLKMRKLYPDHVLSTLRRLAFIRVKEKSYVIDRAIIAHPPWSRRRSWSVNKDSSDSDSPASRRRWRFWETSERPIYKCEDPVFRLDKSPQFREHDPQNDKFTRDVFVASFDMLWSDPKTKSNTKPDTKSDTRSSIEKIQYNNRSPPSWGRILLFIIWVKCKIKRGDGDRVRCYDDIPLEALDNPAVAALIEFKWNTIGYKYWLARFTFQCIFYFLVLLTVFLQVYDRDHTWSLMGIFIAIIVMATFFLLLELQQLLHTGTPYFGSLYNWIDLATFSLPLSGSICQIVNIRNNDEGGNISTLSFSVLFIFLHFLFELKIIRSVCRFVTIIIRTLGSLQIFIIIFLAGIVAFALAILHLARGCPANICDDSEVKFPLHFYRAISSTYFFMGGIWDSASADFDNDNWAFHTMMMLYFFFTTILLLNVLISLINEAFDDAKETWELVWMDNKLRYIEGAETLARSIPGFCETSDLFPKEIYYSATIQQQKAYHDKYFKVKNEDLSGDGDGDSSSQKQTGKKSPPGTGAEAAHLSATDLEALKQGHKDLRMLQETQHKDHLDAVKRELQQTQNQLQALQSQLTEQRIEFKEQLMDIKMFMSALLEARMSEQSGQSGSTVTKNQNM
ncbi:hypothetical protein BGZ65_002668 [Modicella reniformis]|uniref:Ion transport domain-containing protein n=1 Tax=Modicella reniformis TaxID=1440133 RepID=A0A9P6MI51_9FUNG|nr:hypothetical protein BGZ65_002668 [Modicella reniformis]